MTGKQPSQNELLPHLFRQEYAKMTAVLCRHFGLEHIEIAEDIASETFLKASENWAINGVPPNPTAWLYAVAKNRTKDYFKHVAVSEIHIKEAARRKEPEVEQPFEYDNQIIADSQLAMIFAVCNANNSPESQICLALQILCGFSVEEIANAFLTKTETIKKRLLRARANLRKNNFQINDLTETDIRSRLETVLRTLYLVFNEGYFSKTDNHAIRKDLCSEAMRLTLILAENSNTNVPQTNALLALMCFQSSRLEARSNINGETVLFEEQDTNLWDQSLIDKGNYYLVNACHGNEISKYHLEAAIAYWHTTPTAQNKWQQILQLYNQLILVEYSQMAALNRIFALAKVYGYQNAIQEAEKLNLTENNYYHGLLGYLYARVNIERAVRHYQKAMDLTKSKTEKRTLAKAIKRLQEIGTTEAPTNQSPKARSRHNA